jgi:hypothetical protein
MKKPKPLTGMFVFNDDGYGYGCRARNFADPNFSVVLHPHPSASVVRAVVP